jgi:hypothetical protein
MSQFNWPITKKKHLEILEASQNKKSYVKMWCLDPLAHLWRQERENFGQMIWDKVEDG